MKDPSPNWARAITKDEHDRLMATRRRPLTDKHPGLKREHPQPVDGGSLIDDYLANGIRLLEDKDYPI